MSIGLILSIIFVILKATDVAPMVDWSWIYVFSPLIIESIISVFVLWFLWRKFR